MLATLAASRVLSTIAADPEYGYFADVANGSVGLHDLSERQVLEILKATGGTVCIQLHHESSPDGLDVFYRRRKDGMLEGNLSGSPSRYEAHPDYLTGKLALPDRWEGRFVHVAETPWDDD